jgi:hypothetical protein
VRQRRFLRCVLSAVLGPELQDHIDEELAAQPAGSQRIARRSDIARLCTLRCS